MLSFIGIILPVIEFAGIAGFALLYSKWRANRGEADRFGKSISYSAAQRIIL